MIKQENKNNNEEDLLKISLVNQGVFSRKKKKCPLSIFDISEISYKNLKLLDKFLSERGKIYPTRVTYVSLQKQKALAIAIKRARQLALLSPIKQIDVNN
jgi:small subunit ribosomal protein S18